MVEAAEACLDQSQDCVDVVAFHVGFPYVVTDSGSIAVLCH